MAKLPTEIAKTLATSVSRSSSHCFRLTPSPSKKAWRTQRVMQWYHRLTPGLTNFERGIVMVRLREKVYKLNIGGRQEFFLQRSATRSCKLKPNGAEQWRRDRHCSTRARWPCGSACPCAATAGVTAAGCRLPQNDKGR